MSAPAEDRTPHFDSRLIDALQECGAVVRPLLGGGFAFEDDEPSEPDHVALQVLCRVFDDGADVAFPEWRAWYKPAEWFDFSRALGAFIAGRLNDARTDAKPSAWALLNEQGEMFDVKFSEASARAYVRLCADEGGNVSCAPLYLSTAALDRVRDDAARPVSRAALCAALDAFNEWPSGMADRLGDDHLNNDMRCRAMRRALTAARTQPEGQ